MKQLLNIEKLVKINHKKFVETQRIRTVQPSKGWPMTLYKETQDLQTSDAKKKVESTPEWANIYKNKPHLVKTELNYKFARIKQWRG